MKTKISLIIFILLAFCISVQAQNDDNVKSKKKSKIKIKVDKQSIPKNLDPGQSFMLEFEIKNNSKTSEWSSNNLTFEADAPFTVALNSSIGVVTLAPKETRTFSFTVAAPNTEGKEKLKIVFYNDGKREKQVSKTINIGTAKKSDDDKGKNKDKDKDKDKDKNKNKDTNKDKNKEKDDK